MRCGLPEAGAPASDAIYNFEQLPSRVGRNAALMWIYVAARVFQGWAEIDLEDATDYLYLEDTRGARQALTDLETKGLISRKPGASWHFCIHPERIEALPPLDRRAPKNYERHTSHHAASERAAYVNRNGAPTTEGRSSGIGADTCAREAGEVETVDATTAGADTAGSIEPRCVPGGLDFDPAIRAGEPIGDRVERCDVGGLHQQRVDSVIGVENGGRDSVSTDGRFGVSTPADNAAVSETGFTIGLALGVAAAHGMIGQIETGFTFSETGFRPRETYCTWNWTCPHLVNDLPAPKIVDCADIIPTTTAARLTGAERFAIESENAYLARFLQPATRIGELLKIDGMVIDDALAGVMWAECSAVNPDLTPREFVSIANAKLAEWRPRPLDKRPGLRIKSTITGTLRASMPNAVVGALYMLAREQAPSELARDCRDAREILAGDASPRDRAWARAMLAEAGELET